MALIVEKFGGTSIGSVERINAVADHLISKHSAGEKLVVVVSAMSGETNRLIGLANDITDSPSAREMDVLVSTGEQVTIALLSMALQKRGNDARSYTGGQVSIKTDNVHSRARIQDIDGAKIKNDLEQGRMVVQTPRRWPWLRLLKQMNAEFIPTWMAFTPLIRESNPKHVA